MKTYTTAELNDILSKHELWLKGKPSGARANLSCANLYGADLSYIDLSYIDISCADLSYANLSHVDLSYTNLSYANLSHANLSCANLYSANLSDVNLYSTNFYCANLYNVNLSNANLYSAILSGVKNLNYPIICPEKGSFIGFKKAYNSIYSRCYIIKLKIYSDAMRCSATSRKCRCSKARVISITNIDGTKANVDVAYSGYDKEFEYRVGEIVKVDNFDTNRWNECAPGIHFFITREEAVDY